MKKVLKDSRVNVYIKDNETNKTIFMGSNLFVDVGRALIAAAFTRTIIGGSPLNPDYFACDLGFDATAPTADDSDLGNYTGTTSGGLGVSLGIESGYPIILAGTGTGVHFNFIYTATEDTTIKELGLFYRPDPAITDQYPRRHSSSGDPGYLIARLKTTYTSIFVGNTREITIDWKIIF